MTTKFFLLTFLMSGYFAFAQYTTIPDPNFENALSAYDDIPNDGQVPTANINTVTFLDVSGQNISDLTGIEDFTALEGLDCSGNQLTNIDIQQNTTLQWLACADNQLTELNFMQNINLTYLYCSNNLLTSLDLSQNSALIDIRCGFNQITALDLSQNPNLTILECYNNQLVALNIQNGNNITMTNETFVTINNPNLTCIQVDDPTWSTTNWTNIDPQVSFSSNCHYNETYVPDDNFENYLETHDVNGNVVAIGTSNSMGNGIANDDYVTTANINTVTNLDVNGKNISDLTGIEDFTQLITLNIGSNNNIIFDVSQNSLLENLYCFSSNLTSFDVSQNAALKSLYCQNNQLTSVDVNNNLQLETLNCFMNNIGNLDLSINQQLSYLYCTDNALTSLNVQNGNNTNFTTFNATNNPNLTCIFVDNAAWSNANWTNIDTSATFVETQADCNALAVNENILDSFKIYPVPAHNTVIIENTVSSAYKLFSLSGKLLKQNKLTIGKNTVDLSNLSKGVYFINIEGKIKKIILQ